ncbi:MAG: aminotransferase class III-fold pyridoxal phosphate-dependent enzyme [Gemmatimonadetes bacterium]|nr:aminotransferase class III-fold pyridoxal phosphate-dependent enzyme [Gemmatimonadota bacterium]
MHTTNQPQLPATAHKAKKYEGPSFDEVMALRKKHLTPSLLTMYGKPIMIVEGHMQYLYDHTGKRYLDGLGGIATVGVGHCHPRVNKAMKDQLDTLQHATTIYLHPNIAEYARALTDTLPDELSVAYIVNSGSEANDLALTMARLYTGNYDIVALRNAYHGGVTTAMGLTAHGTWKYNVPQGFGVHHALVPDTYRGPFGRDDKDAGRKYADDVAQLIDMATPGQIAGFIAETIQGVGGVTVYPEDYLPRVYEKVRASGGVCIADEVQAGFGRTGTHFWGFQKYDVTPDIVVMAKSMGNGAPIAAVVTKPEIAQALTSRIHFNTFGGNPVSCAAGKAVLDVIHDEKLMQNAKKVGDHILKRVCGLMGKHDLIGDARGSGLMLGIEFVKDRETKAPASEETVAILERVKEMGLLMGKGGLRGNIIRIKPPMCMTIEDADFMVDCLDAAISEM